MVKPRRPASPPHDGPWNRDLLTSKRARAAWRRPARGQSLVEFGLLSILLFTLVAGIVDLGRGVYARTTLSNAVREAARYGATDPVNSEGIINAALNTSAGVALVAPDDGDPNTEDSMVQRFADQGGVIRCTDRNYAWLPPLPADTLAPPAALGLGVVAPALASGLAAAADGSQCVSDFYFRVNGRLATPPDQIPASGINGKQLEVTFVVSPTCTNVRASLTVWKTDKDGKKVGTPYDDAQGGPYGAGEYTLSVSIPNDPNYGYVVEFRITGDTAPSPTPVPPTATKTSTPTVTATATKTPVPPPTATATPRPPTNTPGPPTATSTPKPPTATPTVTNTPQPTATPTITPTPKPTNTPGPPTATATPKPPTNTPGPTNTPTVTPTATNTPPPTATPTVTNTPRPTNTPTITPTPTNTVPPTATPTNTPTDPGGLGDTSFENRRDANGRIIPQDCEYPRVGNLLTVCAAYNFQLALPGLIGFGNIPMKECASVDIQSTP